MFTLTLKNAPSVALEAEVLSPDRLAGRTLAEAQALQVFHGRKRAQLGDFFELHGQPGDDVVLRGDLSRVKWIGRGMTRGRLRIEGNAGMHLGSQMRGGRIELTGDADDWLGAEMHGGEIQLQGNAGAHVGAAYQGSEKGMRGGVIHIGGSAGAELGRLMRRGVIVAAGIAGEFAGLQMKGGTICLLAGAHGHVGAWMTRGTIISVAPLAMLPTYTHNCDSIPTVLRLVGRQIARLGSKLPCEEQAGVYQQFSGDFRQPGRGEIFVWKSRTALATAAVAAT